MLDIYARTDVHLIERDAYHVKKLLEQNSSLSTPFLKSKINVVELIGKY